jgi:hypothetical protein
MYSARKFYAKQLSIEVKAVWMVGTWKSKTGESRADQNMERQSLQRFAN